MSDRYMSAFPWQPDAQETGMTLRDYIAVQALGGRAMRVKVRLLPHHQQVLEALRDLTLPRGEHCVGFNAIAHLVGMDRAEVRRIVRHLARRGLAEYHRGLWTYDGQMAGAGYCVTHTGITLLAERLVEDADG